MAAGPHEQRLRSYLEPARRWQVFMAKEQWKKGADRLEAVAEAVQHARPLARDNLGNQTADAADQAFVAMHDKVLARQRQMRDGALALQAAIEAIGRAEAVRNGFDAAGPLSEPSPPDWAEDELRQIQQMKAHNAQMSSYHSQLAAREDAALAAIQDLDSTNSASAETMRKIQGDRPDVPSGGGGGGGAGGGGSGGGLPPTGGRTSIPGPRTTPPTNQSTNPPTDPPTNAPTNPPTDPPTNAPTDPPTHPPTHPPSDPGPRLPGETGTPLGPAAGTSPAGTPGTLTSPGPVTSGVGGLAGAVSGGMAGAALGMGGAIRAGSLSAGATGASGTTRAIGSSARTGSSGALGRGAGAGSTARGAGGRGAGAEAGGRGRAGAQAGGRGAGRGAAAGAGGRRGRRGNDDGAPRTEAIIGDQDWVDDEDAAPGVIS